MHSKQHRVAGRVWQTLALAAAVCLAGSAAAAPVQQPTASQLSAQKETHITPDQAKQLFALVDELIKFSSQETGLPIKSTVKRQLTTRATVESYLKEKFDEDQGAKRLQKGEIVLKKFGPVSYTHLDVYKRQLQCIPGNLRRDRIPPRLLFGLLPALIDHQPRAAARFHSLRRLNRCSLTLSRLTVRCFFFVCLELPAVNHGKFGCFAHNSRFPIHLSDLLTC